MYYYIITKSLKGLKGCFLIKRLTKVCFSKGYLIVNLKGSLIVSPRITKRFHGGGSKKYKKIP